MSTLITPVQHPIGHPASEMRQGKQQQQQQPKTQVIKSGKEIIKLSLFRDDMIIYAENPKKGKNIPELIN